MKRESAAKPALTKWERGLTYLLFATSAWVAFLALNIAVASNGLVPGYDGLAYLNAALRVNVGFISGDWMLLWRGLPFTNTLDVLLLALLYKLVDYHIGIWLIHTAYVVVFFALLRRVLDVTTTALIFLWAISHALFLHQYTQFISEMKVGMFLILFTVYLFHDEKVERARPLFWITILLLLLRVINILFVLPLAAAYAVIRWRKGADWKQVFAGLQPVALALLFLSPLLLAEMWSVIPYMYKASYSDMAQNWRDMAGVTGKWSLLLSYGDNLMLYQRALVIGAMSVIALGLVLHVTPATVRLVQFRNYAVATLVIFGVLMQAQSNNVMLAYWLYMFLGLSALAVVVAVLRPVQVGLVACLLVPVALYVNYSSFKHMNQSIAQQRPTMELANGLAQSIAAVPKPAIFQNYYGIGPLDFQGLEIAANRIVGRPPVNNVSYNTDLSAYLAALEAANVVFIANRNFMWPTFLGVNHKTEAIAREVSVRAEQLGLIRASRLHSDSDAANYIDVYLRPTVTVKLKYLQFGDHWLDQDTAVVLRYGERAQALNGYVMELDMSVPGVDDPAFTLPLTVTLKAPEGKVVKTAVVERAGPNKVVFPLDGLLPGTYRILFDKAFSTKNDPRKLSALFGDATLKHVNAPVNNGGRSE
jgi:hypothetical protein